MAQRKILLLGTPRIEQDGRLIRLERRKAVALLAYLAVTRQYHPRETLAALFFPDADASRAAAYLRNALWTISKALGDDWLVNDGETILLNSSAELTTDIQEFQTLFTENTPAALTQSVALVRGEFMAGFTLEDCPDFDDWRFFQAQAFNQRYARVLELLAEHHAAHPNYTRALEYAVRWLALDNLNEAAHRLIMRVYAYDGQSTAALRHYQELVRTLQTELGTTPAPETIQLYEEIQARRIAVPTAARTTRPATTTDTLPALPRRNTLPAALTPFIGRTAELTELTRLLLHPDCHLLTLIGQGGIGKTRLAIQAASDHAAEFADGVCFVPLVGVAYADLVPQAVASALDFRAESEGDLNNLLANYLRDKHLLLILDNCEHLLESATFIGLLLASAPHLKILATSRERLNLQEEWLFETSGLRYPTPEDDNPLEFSAVRLFLQSARRVRSDFEPTDLESIITICRLVEGLPLGLELAATWVKMLTCAEIATEIQKGVDFLAATMRNLPERHRSLRAVFESSWQQLTIPEQQVFARLAVFQGGFQQDAAQFVTGAALPILLALMNKSLLRRNIYGRYELHELVRQYAQQKLTPEELLLVQTRHSRWYAELLGGIADRLCGDEEIAALDEIQREMDNIRFGFVAAIAQKQIETLNGYLNGLQHFFSVRINLLESTEVCQRAIAALSATSPNPEERLLLGRFLTMQASNYNHLARPAQRDDYAAQAIVLLRQFPQRPETISYLARLGMIKNIGGVKDPLALEYATEALALAQRYPDRWADLAVAHYALGTILHNQVEYAAAREHINEGLRLYRRLNQLSGMAMCLNMLGENLLTQGDYVGMREALHEGLQLYVRLDNRIRIRAIWFALSDETREPAEQLQLLEENLKLLQAMGEQRRVIWTMYNIAWLRHVNHELDAAEVMARQVQPMFEEMQELEGRVWTRILKASIAIQRGQPAAARLAAAEARATIGNHPFPWGISGIEYILGDAALLEGDLVTARHHFCQAVQIAHEVQSVFQVLRHLLGIAAVRLAEGALEDALMLAVFALQHPLTAEDVMFRARDLRAAAEAQLSAADSAAATARGKALTLEAAVTAFA